MQCVVKERDVSRFLGQTKAVKSKKISLLIPAQRSPAPQRHDGTASNRRWAVYRFQIQNDANVWPGL